MAAVAVLELHPDRLLPPDTAIRPIARRLYELVAELPVVSPHGHVDAALLADDQPFANPAALLVTPDHYVTRLLHASGVPLSELGANAEPRHVWRRLCGHWEVFRGTATRQWLEAELVQVFGVGQRPSAENADALYDQLCARLAAPEFRPRALYHRMGVEVLATTDDPASDLAAHIVLRDDPTWDGRLVPTFRPDAYLEVRSPGWDRRLGALGEAAGVDIDGYETFLDALARRRATFVAMGATATDHGHLDAGTEPLDPAVARRLFSLALDGTIDEASALALRRHLVFEMAAMAADDGLVMAIHPGVLRGHHRPTTAAFGPDTGHDIPVAVELTRSLRPLLERFGTSGRFRLVVFSTDETIWSRELAPLAGFYPNLYIGAPWWFLDAPDAMARFRAAVTETAGFSRSAGFVDDTRALCSIAVRHDVARRVDCGYLSRLVAEHRLDEDEAAQVALDLAGAQARRVFRL